MDIAPWRPLGELSSVRREMDRLWNRFLGETPFARTAAEEWSPSVDISETKDKLAIKAELPGLDAKDVNVSITGDILTIKGEKKRETESFKIPVNVKNDKIEATFDKGVLKIVLPKTEASKKKEIEIKVK